MKNIDSIRSVLDDIREDHNNLGKYIGLKLKLVIRNYYSYIIINDVHGFYDDINKKDHDYCKWLQISFYNDGKIIKIQEHEHSCKYLVNKIFNSSSIEVIDSKPLEDTLLTLKERMTL